MMRASRESVAYKEFEQYEQRFLPTGNEPKQPLRLAPEQKRRAKHRVRPNLMLAVGVSVVVALYILVCQMQMTKLTADVTSQTKLLDELAAESVLLSSKQAYELDMSEIESYAVKNLGMVKMDNSQIEYIELTNPDNITVSSAGMSLDTLFSGLARSFSAVVEYLR